MPYLLSRYLLFLLWFSMLTCHVSPSHEPKQSISVSLLHPEVLYCDDISRCSSMPAKKPFATKSTSQTTSSPSPPQSRPPVEYIIKFPDFKTSIPCFFPSSSHNQTLESGGSNERFTNPKATDPNIPKRPPQLFHHS